MGLKGYILVWDDRVDVEYGTLGTGVGGCPLNNAITNF